MVEDVLGWYECEKQVEGLQYFDVEEFASSKWLQQHRSIALLNVQSHINALLRGDEFVMEALATLDKVEWISSVR